MKERGLIKRDPTDIDLAIVCKDSSQESVILNSILKRMGFAESDIYYDCHYEHLGAKSQMVLKMDNCPIPINVHFIKKMNIEGNEPSDSELVTWKREALERRGKTSDILDVYYIEYKKEISVEVAQKIATFAEKAKIKVIEAIHQYELFRQG